MFLHQFSKPLSLSPFSIDDFQKVFRVRVTVRVTVRVAFSIDDFQKVETKPTQTHDPHTRTCTHTHAHTHARTHTHMRTHMHT